MNIKVRLTSSIQHSLGIVIFVICGLTNFFNNVQANEIISISENFPIIKILTENQILYLEDFESGITETQILEKLDLFHPYSRDLIIDTKKIYWIKLVLKNNLNTKMAFRITYPGWQEARTFLVSGGKIIQKLKKQGRAGTFNEFADVNPYTTPFSTLKDQFAVINIGAGETLTILSRLRSDRVFAAKTLLPNLLEHNAYSQMRRLGIYIEGFMIGSVFALMIFSAFSAYRNKEKTLGLYSLWLFTAMASVLTQTTHDGIRFSEFFVDTTNMALNSLVPTAWSIWIFFAFSQAMMYVVFARSFLNLKLYYPKIHIATNLYLIWYLMFYLIDIVFQPYIYSSDPYFFIVLPHLVSTPIILLTIFVCAFFRYKKGMVIAKYYMWAALPYLFFRSIFLSGWLGIPNPFNYLPQSGVGFFFQSSSTIQILGMFLESLIMALAVVARTKYLQDQLNQKIKEQKLLLDHQNIQLEDTVRKRTSELTEKTEFLKTVSSNLAKYLPPQIHEAFFSGSHNTDIKTRRKKLTIFFSDIKNFTPISENLQPEDLTKYINEYFSEMTEIALRNGGTIDKYMGDAMMVFFGDPDTKGERNDARSCVTMALEMQKKMTVLQKKWKEEGFNEPFEIRMGMNTGYCNVGNFGSEQRLTYTIIGAEVNVAQRLESAADVGGILLSYETYAHTKDLIRVEERETIQMKGINRRIKVFSAINSETQLTEANRIVAAKLKSESKNDKSDLMKIKTEIENIEKAHHNEISELKILISKLLDK